VILLAGGACVRVTSIVQPAFGGELCRLRLEPLARRPETLGSFFDPSRRGLVYGMPATAGASTLGPASREGWSYGGESLRARLGAVTRVRVLRERVGGMSGEHHVSWMADRGLVLTGADGRESLFLAEPLPDEQAAFLPALGAFRALIDPGHPTTPGATTRELLGYGDWDARLDIELALRPP
jgi:hypothetical protein